jgi:methyl-accepting chemotaxis protein
MKQRADGLPTEVTTTINTHYQPAMSAYQKSQRDFVALQEQAYEKTRIHYAQRAKELIAMSSILMALLVAAILGGAAWLIRSIRHPLLGANELAARIAQGDLSMQIDTSRGDEFGDLMRSLAAMNESLGRMVNQVRQSTDSIATASAEIATGNNDLAQRTEQTSSNLQSTASSMDQLTTNVQQSADNARQASVLAANASSVAEKGGAVVQQVVTTMEEINVSSKKIADIIGVIDGIAFQTNILALNAAVEAARAGEQGRGFAVVASEVRSLAQRSAEAAKEIKTLIGTSVDKVASGTKLVSDAGATMSDIVQSVRKVADVIGEITAASGEQSTGIAHVNQAIGNLDQMTQQNAALVEESAAAAESLREQASQLAQAVSVFKISGSVVPVHSRPTRDITPRAESISYKRPQPLAKPKPASAALGHTRAAAPARKPLALSAAKKPAPAPAQPADADWETF